MLNMEPGQKEQYNVQSTEIQFLSTVKGCTSTDHIRN